MSSSSTEDNIRKLHEASKMGSIQVLETLLEEDPNLIQKLPLNSSCSKIESPLHVSVSHGHLEFTRILLDRKPELAAEVDTFQRTPLHLATANGDMEMVRALLETNTSACLVRDQNGLIPLHYAACRGHIEIMQELINARPQSIWIKLDNGQTILHLCVRSNHLEAMKLLLANIHEKDFVNTMDDAGNTILDLSFMLRQSEMVGYLVSIPELKSGTSIANVAFPKEISLGSQKKKWKRLERRESTSTMPSAKKTRGRWKAWTNKLKYRGDWVEEVQGTMMLVATVIATVTFQAAINPPGGVWQEDTIYNWSIFGSLDRNGTVYEAGTSIMAKRQAFTYLVYLMANTVSFLASASVILLIISRFPLKNRICSWLLRLAMSAAVFFLTIAYLMGAAMVNIVKGYSEFEFETLNGFSIAIISWMGLVILVVLFHVIRFLIWLLKTLWRTFTCRR